MSELQKPPSAGGNVRGNRGTTEDDDAASNHKYSKTNDNDTINIWPFASSVRTEEILEVENAEGTREPLETENEKEAEDEQERANGKRGCKKEDIKPKKIEGIAVAHNEEHEMNVMKRVVDARSLLF
jgi:hypothetical protein